MTYNLFKRIKEERKTVMKRSWIRLVTSQSGISLIEILASIVLLSLVIGPFMTLFIQSGKTNSITHTIDNATYVANSQMEYMYSLSTTYSLSQVPSNIGTDYVGTLQNCASGAQCFTSVSGDPSIFIQLTPVAGQAPLVDVLVKVFKNGSTHQPKAQMETIYSWKS